MGVHFGDEKAVKRLVFALVLLSSLPLAGDDWPQYLGADRDAVWREAGVELDFSKRAPRLLWSSPRWISPNEGVPMRTERRRNR